MQRSLGMFLTLATLSVAHAQYTDPAGQPSSTTSPYSQPAPIVQAYPGGPGGGAYRRGALSEQLFDSQPSAGVSVRSDVANGVQTVTSSNAVTEVRVAQGRADVMVHHPANHSEILIDLPGGQVALLKDGLYTFNAGSNTVRVLHGEAEAYTGAKDAATKGTKVKETQELSFLGNAKLKAVNAYPYELTADLLPPGGAEDGRVAYAGYGPYGDGVYPYYPGVYPYGYGFYPYPYGYPIGVGFGFGYYGGFGGYRGFRR